MSAASSDMTSSKLLVSVSTSMFSGREMSEAGIHNLLEAGLDRLELGVDLSDRDVSLLSRMWRTGVISVSSVHNYCPRPPGVPAGYGSGDLFSLSSLDEAERDTAVRTTRQTITLAASLKCSRVVLHCGDVPAATALRKSTHFSMFAPVHATTEEIMRLRQAEVRKHLDALRSSLEQLLGTAHEAAVVLGLENRFHLDEIPSLVEAHTLVREFGTPCLGTWLDTGHAFVLAGCLGQDALSLIREFRDDLVGWHVHDVAGSSDHLVPGEGTIPLEDVLGEIGPLQPLVLELSPGTPLEALEPAMKLLRDMVREWP